MSALDHLLGKTGDPLPTECKIVVAGQIEMHWYPSWTPDAKCFCGARTWQDPSDPEPVWHTTPRIRKGHLLQEAETAEGAAITLCGRHRNPDDVWTAGSNLNDDERCGSCRRIWKAWSAQ